MTSAFDRYGRARYEELLRLREGRELEPAEQAELHRLAELAELTVRTDAFAEALGFRSPDPDASLETLPASDSVHGSDRASRVESFLRECNQVPGISKKIRRKHIWLAAKHEQPRQFQHWQAGDPESTATDETTFARLLAMPPAEFVSLLVARKIL